MARTVNEGPPAGIQSPSFCGMTLARNHWCQRQSLPICGEYADPRCIPYRRQTHGLHLHHDSLARPLRLV